MLELCDRYVKAMNKELPTLSRAMLQLLKEYCSGILRTDLADSFGLARNLAIPP